MMCEELREHKTANCDFFPGEEISFETDEDFLARVRKLKTIIEAEKKGVERTLLVGHCDLFWHLSSHVHDGERFGTFLQNAEFHEWEQDIHS